MTAVSAPVVVGGVGGSGTRVVASVLDAAGVDVGADLNPSMDNLWFTLLFKSRRVHARMHHDPLYARRSFELFEKLSTGPGRLSAWEIARLASSAARVAVRGHNRFGHGRGRWALGRLRSMARVRGRAVSRRWGWKEPCSHLYVELLARHWPDAVYLHVVRDGRDMAFSDNVQDLYLWGPLLGVPPPRDGDDPDALAAALLRHWAAANSWTLDVGTAALGDRFVLLRFEDLCADPEATIDRLLERLDVVAGVERAGLARLVRAPASLGRHHSREVPGLGPTEAEVLKRLGYGL